MDFNSRTFVLVETKEKSNSAYTNFFLLSETVISFEWQRQAGNITLICYYLRQMRNRYISIGLAHGTTIYMYVKRKKHTSDISSVDIYVRTTLGSERWLLDMVRARSCVLPLQ